jgi:hypothetical protein
MVSVRSPAERRGGGSWWAQYSTVPHAGHGHLAGSSGSAVCGRGSASRGPGRPCARWERLERGPGTSTIPSAVRRRRVARARFAAPCDHAPRTNVRDSARRGRPNECAPEAGDRVKRRKVKTGAWLLRPPTALTRCFAPSCLLPLAFREITEQTHCCSPTLRGPPPRFGFRRVSSHLRQSHFMRRTLLSRSTCPVVPTRGHLVAGYLVRAAAAQALPTLMTPFTFVPVNRRA